MDKKIIAIAFIVFVSFAFHSIAASEQYRDPTQPLDYAVKKTVQTKLVLQAILDRNGGKKAIVNNQQVKVGDVVAGAVITRITDKKVFYRRDGARNVLVLRPSIR